MASIKGQGQLAKLEKTSIGLIDRICIPYHCELAHEHLQAHQLISKSLAAL